MRVRFLGHSSFVLETGNKKILTDPFNEKLGYPVFQEPVDIATISHDHWDHNAAEILARGTRVIRTAGIHSLEDIVVTGYPTFHDRSQGKERGANIVFKITAEGLNILHLGDLGEPLSAEQIADWGPIDVLMIPVGSVYTIDAYEAAELAARIAPAICIPMHFATPLLTFELESLTNFTQQFDTVLYKGDLRVTAGELPDSMQVVVLEYPDQ